MQQRKLSDIRERFRKLTGPLKRQPDVSANEPICAKLQKNADSPLFLEDWDNQSGLRDNTCELQTQPGLSELKKWRLQTILSLNPWGIPSLAFSQAYYRIFNHELDLEDLGFADMSDMIWTLTDIFAVQEPDEMTSYMFPDYPMDRILHDARLSHSFIKDKFMDERIVEKNLIEWLLGAAAMNRDIELPQDIVKPGEKYAELVLSLTKAQIPGTRGVHKALITSAANPEKVYINLENPDLDIVDRISMDVAIFFSEVPGSIETYSMPKELIVPEYPCLLYQQREQVWERCSIIELGKDSKNVIVESVDFGGIAEVDASRLYLMPRRFLRAPRQALAVSLGSLKPAGAECKWRSGVGKRIRCFSHSKYWLDCLLFEPLEASGAKPSSDDIVSSSLSIDQLDISEAAVIPTIDKPHEPNPTNRKSKRNRRADIQFSALLCDRNDPDMDVYIDDILVMEFYANPIEDDKQTIATLKSKFASCLETLPRPENPFACNNEEIGQINMADTSITVSESV